MTADQIKSALEQGPLKDILASEDFYFQKGQDALNRWVRLSLTPDEEKYLFERAKDYHSFMEASDLEEKIKDVRSLLLEIIAYCDNRARYKSDNNRYDDDRVLADASVRMGDWIEGLLKFKFKPNELTGQSIINALNYLLEPQKNCTVLSERHREMLSENLLGKTYNPKNFIKNLVDHFAQYDLNPENPDNLTHAIARLCYSFKNKWVDEVIGLMASDGTGWQEGAMNLDPPFEQQVIWNSKRFSGSTRTYNFLKAIIKEGGSFPIYYASNGKVRYRANIIDFAWDQKELNQKNWDKKRTKGYFPSFDQYRDTNKTAKILFLADSIEKIEPVPISNFSFFSSYQAPRQDNISPIKSIDISPTSIASKSQESNLNLQNLTRMPLNQIFYGPPGTGKTYSTVVEALAIIEEKGKHQLQNEPYHILKARYDDLVSKGQIAFTTFHQNMSYEDFVEGIKPLEPKEEGDPISYKVIPGIFKRISEEAMENLNYIGTKEHSSLEPSFELAFAKLNREVAEAQFADTIKIKDRDVTGLRINLQSSYFIIPKIDGYSIKMINSEGKSNNSMTRETLRKIYENTDQIEDLISGGMRGYYLALVKQMKSWKFDINEDAKKVERKNFVLIIDEINRGNVSSIFGELITLLEETKRAGKPEALEITLPYSKEPFSVPSNLYVIGTMNTADRSVEALDTALRRRFVFQALMPDPSLLRPSHMISRLWNDERFWECGWDEDPFRGAADDLYSLLGLDSSFESKHDQFNWSKTNLFRQETLEYLDADNTEGFDLEEILATINLRISLLLDEDHQIGHSFFMKANSINHLKLAFSKEIIPLLKEYFYGDYAKISLVLGEGICQGKTGESLSSNGLFAEISTDYDQSIFLDKILYKINEPVEMDDDEFKDAINQLLNKKTGQLMA